VDSQENLPYKVKVIICSMPQKNTRSGELQVFTKPIINLNNFKLFEIYNKNDGHLNLLYIKKKKIYNL